MNKNKNQTQLNITHGNDISLLVTLMRDGEPFPTHLAQGVKVSILSRMGYRQALNFQLDVDKLLVDIPAKIVMTNVYGLLIEGTLGGSQWRTFYESLLRYTDFTEAMLTDSVQQRGDSFDLTMDVQLYKGIDEVKMDERISEHNEDEEAHRAQFAAMKRLIDLEKVLPKTYAELVQLRDEARFIPGQWYRIVDYVTTTMQNDTQSAGHPFDILVMASKPDTLLETAFAAVHEGDTYFQNSKLEAWELKYSLDNIQHSAIAGTYCIEDCDEYSLKQAGTVDVDGTTYVLWQCDQNLVEDYGAEYAVSDDADPGTVLSKYYPDTHEIAGDEWSSEIRYSKTIEEDGKGTITFMRDEFGNECPYDFKNIMFKRWLATDNKPDRNGLNGRYMIGAKYSFAAQLDLDDEDDYIWAFTFSSDANGGEQEDYSLGQHNVYGNIFKPNSDGTLPNNVMFGEYNYFNRFGVDCNLNTLGNGCSRNSWGNNCQNNSWGNNCQNNSWGNDCNYNSWGNGCYYNSWGNVCQNNSWGNNCQNNSWGNDCFSNSYGNNCGANSWGNSCGSNSWGNDCSSNSWGNGCSSNSWGNEISFCTVFDGVQYTQITTAKVKYAQVLNGVAGTSSSKLTLTFVANKNYTQVACKNSSNALKIYIPGDLA